MLRETFVHLPGVGETAERRLWRQGCHDWDAFLANPKKYSAGSASRELVRRELVASVAALETGNHQFFRKRLRAKNAWRALDAFEGAVGYLDIETDGSNREDNVTVVGLYDGKTFHAFVQGDNLENFRDLVSRMSVLVTFFGTGFDLPVLQRRFPDLPLDQIHIDLHPLLAKLGYRGGLKRIEPRFGIQRSEETAGLTGRDAVFLWRKHMRGQEGALETLIAYNREDVVNLEILMQAAYDLMRRRTLVHRQDLLPGFEDI